MKKGLIAAGLTILLVFSVVSLTPSPGRGMYLVSDDEVSSKIENFDTLLFQTFDENYAAVVKRNLENYDENFLGWAEGIEEISYDAFHLLLSALRNHRKVLENFKAFFPAESVKKSASSPPASYKLSPKPWEIGGEVLFYDDENYGKAKTGQRGWWGGFSLPPIFGSVDGIEATIKDTYIEPFKAGNGWKVALSWDNAVSWTEQKQIVVEESTYPGGTYSVGGDGDLWGRVWSPQEIPYLFVEIASSFPNNYTGWADWLYVTAFFTEDWAAVQQYIDSIITHLTSTKNTLELRFWYYMSWSWEPLENWASLKLNTPAVAWRGVEGWSSGITAKVPPPVVITENFFETISEKVTLSWSPVPLATQYEVQISETPNFETLVYFTKETFLEVSLTPGRWYWRVRAYVGDVAGEWSPTYVIDVAVARFTPVPPPPTPLSLSILFIALPPLAVILLLKRFGKKPQ